MQPGGVCFFVFKSEKGFCISLPLLWCISNKKMILFTNNNNEKIILQNKIAVAQWEGKFVFFQIDYAANISIKINIFTY